MKRRLLLIAGIVLTIVFAVGGLWVYQNSREQGPTVEQTDINTEQVQEQTAANPDAVIKQGEFTDADPVHKGSGQAKIIEFEGSPVLKFENFQTTPGPDLFVYLSPNAAGEDLGKFVSLGKLKSNSGDQIYNLPDDYDQYKTVVIWCKAFSVTFTTAEFQ